MRNEKEISAVQVTTNHSANEVNYTFKILYAFGMIFIVAGHCSNGGISLVYDWFTPYSFHLGLFVFASGYFYNKYAEQNIGKYVLKKVKRLILPLYAWNLAYGLFVTFLHTAGFSIGEKLTIRSLLLDPVMHGHQFAFNMGGWFVVPLFMVQMYNVITRKIVTNFIKKEVSEWFYALAGMALGVLGVFLASRGYYYDGWLILVRMLYFIPFYEIGYLYRVRLEKKDKIPNVLYFGIIFGIQLFIFYKYGKQVSYKPSWCNDFQDGVVLPFVVGFIGIAFWLRVSKILTPALKNSRAVKIISDNTFAIMLHQFLGFLSVNTLFALLNKYSGLCQGFDFELYKSDIWYYYLPGNVQQSLIIYLVAGIVVPLCIQLFVNIVIRNVIKIRRKA